MLREFGGQAALRRRRQAAGFIDDTSGQRRKDRLRRTRQTNPQRQPQQSGRQKRQPDAVQNLTFGAAWASSEIVKVSFTLASG